MAPRRKKQRLSEDGDEGGVVLTASPKSSAKNPDEPKLSDSKPEQRRTLFVRNLPTSTTNDSLVEHFSQSYPLKHATVVTDSTTKQCKGYGFVTFVDAEDAERAKEEFNGSKFQDKKIRVEIAEPRHRNEESGDKASKAIELKANREKERVEARQPPRLIIRNLPWSIKEPDELALLFRSYGKVKHAVLPKQKSGALSGFGFVVLRGRKNAEKAIEAVNGKEVDGRTLAVDWAVDQNTWQKQQHEIDGGVKLDAESGDEAGNEQNDEDEHLAPDEDDENKSEEESNSEGDIDDELEDGDEDQDDADEGDTSAIQHKPDTSDRTLFIRNIPWSATDDSLHEHFTSFGPVRYARVVYEPGTERPRGTAFVCFYKKEDADACLKGSLKPQTANSKDKNTHSIHHSVLQNVDDDPTGHYTFDGRVLQISRAVDRSEAARLTAEGVSRRGSRDKDKRRLYLLSEGTIPSNSPLYKTLAPSEIAMREASAKQRKALIESNPSLHLSLTRLSVRNIPRSITSKDLKALAREAVVGFAKDVKADTRQPLSLEEKSRHREEMDEAEAERKAKGRGVVRQATVIFEGREGTKVKEDTGAGRSRGYGFIEYYTHRSALMGLRWLNGYAVGYTAAQQQKGKKGSKEDIQDRKKRLIVEFAIENAQVVARRKEREQKLGNRGKGDEERAADGEGNVQGKRNGAQNGARKRKRGSEADGPGERFKGAPKPKGEDVKGGKEEDKLAKRTKIIARKRMARRARRKGEKA
ncbi:RNA-binding domain-containing protein [Patellaria atrata CBS 101060]|uniref:RNA-binding domain-containing protein n=1 Tax=Patellaria atrata CBS 101060 TaxID=1346257 RepID=A0A9P4SA12_9PEZI|nr:RNA-binding domain-containing protein [Patellaria atrata CBS 101060]